MTTRLIQLLLLLMPALLISACGDKGTQSTKEMPEPKVSVVRISTHPVEQKDLQPRDWPGQNRSGPDGTSNNDTK